MPQQKRALAEADGNAQPEQPNSKRSKAADQVENVDAASRSEKSDTPAEPLDASSNAEATDEPDLPDDHIEKRPPTVYICMSKPPYAGIDTFDDNSDEEEDDDRDEEEKAAEEAEPDDGSDPHRVRTTTVWNRLAVDYPAWPYTIMAGTWSRLCDSVILARNTNPEDFGMYVHNDFHPYGIVEILENMLIDFNKSHGTSNEKPDLDRMWSTVAVIAHFLNRSDGPDMWLCIDDGERCGQTHQVLGTALLTALHLISQAGELKQDSKYRDLGLIMALWLKLSIQPAEIPMEDEDLYWRPCVVAYAKKAGIDLLKQQIAGIEESIKVLDGPASEVELNGNGDVWKWRSRFKELSPRGGDSHNIMMWTRQQRASAAFDGKDPLQEFSAKDLKEGNIMVA